ncbi:MAG: type II toxin-antitoxin system VapC family toxin [Actinomycetota bacterium]
MTGADRRYRRAAPAADNWDPDHDACAQLLQDDPGPLVTTALVIAETAYLIGRQRGAHDEARFFRSIADGDLHLETLTAVDDHRIADLVDQYFDLGLGGTDASLVAIAERLGQTRIATLDRRHFTVVRPAHTDTFELIP